LYCTLLDDSQVIAVRTMTTTHPIVESARTSCNRVPHLRPSYCTMISAASPLPLAWLEELSLSCSPSGSDGGRSLPASLAFISAQSRSRTKPRMRASPRVPVLVRMASLTLFETWRRSAGFSSSSSCGCKVSAGRKMRRDMVSSRSFRNSGFVAARGASWEEAKFRAGVMSALGVEVHLRINSMS
jgi:hypothetical protein